MYCICMCRHVINKYSCYCFIIRVSYESVSSVVFRMQCRICFIIIICVLTNYDYRRFQSSFLMALCQNSQHYNSQTWFNRKIFLRVNIGEHALHAKVNFAFKILGVRRTNLNNIPILNYCSKQFFVFRVILLLLQISCMLGRKREIRAGIFEIWRQ